MLEESGIKVGFLYSQHQQFLEMQILRSHPIPTESETLALAAIICVIISPLGDSDAQ